MILKIKRKLSSDDHFRDLISGSIVSMLIKVVGISLGFILLYILTQKIGSIGLGKYQLFVQLLMLTSVLGSLGFKNSILRFASQYLHDKPNSNHKYLFRLSIQLVLITSLILSVILLLLKFFASDLKLKIIGEVSYSTIYLLILALPFFTFHQILIELLRGLHKYRSSEIFRNITIPAITILGMIFFIHSDSSHESSILTYITAIIATSLTIAIYVFFTLKNGTNESELVLERNHIFKTSIPMMLSDLGYTLSLSIPFFLIMYFGSEKDVGLFTVPFRIANIITIILVVVNTVSGPKFSFLFWNKSVQELQKFANNAVRLATLISLLPLALIFVFTPHILSVFGSEYSYQSDVLRVLLLAQFINVVAGSNGLLLNMSGHEKTFRNILFISVFFLIISGAYLTNYYGSLGVAIAFLISQLIWNVLAIYYVKKKTGIITYFRFKI